jgi:hypothetical protein
MPTIRTSAPEHDTAPVQRRRYRTLLALTPFLLLLLATHLRLFLPISSGLAMARRTIETRTKLTQLTDANAGLRAEIAYLQTAEGRALAVRQKLGVVAPGERLIRLVELKPEGRGHRGSFADRTQAAIQGARAAAAGSVRYAGEVLGVWLGVGEAPQSWCETAAVPAAPPVVGPPAPVSDGQVGAASSVAGGEAPAAATKPKSHAAATHPSPTAKPKVASDKH